MKNLFLTLSVLVYSLATVAQNDIIILNTVSITAKDTSNYNPLSSFTMDVASEGKFNYRKFLRKEKKIEGTFQLGEQELTNKELAKIIRRGARTSENFEAFEMFLINKDPMFKSYLSTNDMALLYQKFREGTFDKYLDDLASNI